MFRKLGMPRTVRLETLTLGDFLLVIDRVHEELQFLKALTSRAQVPLPPLPPLPLLPLLPLLDC